MNSVNDGEEITKWLGVMLYQDKDLISSINSGWTSFRKKLISDSAEGFYEGIRNLADMIVSPVNIDLQFSQLSAEEKEFWYSYASSVPGKLKILNLYIRPYSEYCRTCLITDTDIEKLGAGDHASFFSDDADHTSFTKLPRKKKRFLYELNYLIPLQLKNAGFEIVRKEEIAEIDEKVVKKIARAIHSRYQGQMRIKYQGKRINRQEMNDFDKLPREIKLSNIDNAWHIPTKLLSVGYTIRHAKKGHKPFALSLTDSEIETMAGVEHLRWSWDKRLNGWVWGKKKDKKKKRHPSLVNYNMLPEEEKDKDRELVRLIPSLLQDIAYEASHVNPNRISKLSYAVKPLSSIHKILNETRELNDQIRGMVSLTPELEKMVAERNRKIGEAITEIEGSYNYAHHIQETFLPDDLFIRECSLRVSYFSNQGTL